MSPDLNLLLAMRHVAAYLLAVLGGNESPSAADVKSILSSVGVEADKDNLARVIAALKGKSVPELIEAGLEKIATVPGGAGSGSGGRAAAVAAANVAEAAEEKKEEKKPVSEDSSDEDMGLGLFD